MGGVKNCDFRPISRFISEIIQDSHSYHEPQAQPPYGTCGTGPLQPWKTKGRSATLVPTTLRSLVQIFISFYQKLFNCTLISNLKHMQHIKPIYQFIIFSSFSLCQNFTTAHRTYNKESTHYSVARYNWRSTLNQQHCTQSVAKMLTCSLKIFLFRFLHRHPF